MAAALLSDILSGKVEVALVKEWLSLQGNFPQKHEFPCTQGDFVSYLLNYIHEEALCFEKYRETPKKVHTPKPIKKLELASSSHKPKRRSALFPDRTTGNSLRACNLEVEDRKSCESSPKTVLLSPISPLHTRLNALSVDNLNSPKSRTLCLGDFISPNRKTSARKSAVSVAVETGTSENESKRSRRINPTNVTQRKPLTSENSFDFISADGDDDRGELTAENLKLPTTSALSGKVKKPQQTEIPPELGKVMQKQQLALLGNLYIHLINNNMVLNTTSELYFILTLLLSKQYDTDYFNSKLFTSIHNVVYFAVECLTIFSESDNDAALSSNYVLSLLDKSALRLLATNERVKCLNLDKLVGKLKTADEEIKGPRKPYQETREINVCFDSDTDNREHFPSDPSFNAFRKQRDMFYEILHAWQANHTSDGWNFSLGLSGKIKNLLGMHNDPANFRHLSRLVKSQLLATCIMREESIHENHLTFLTTLPNVNAEKLNRLKTRIVAKDSSNGINSPPSFPGVQEFYKDFIIQANNAVFLAHLKNVFIQDLLQINETSSCLPETEIVDEETRNNYMTITKSLQILAKFSSFIESLPYQNQTKSIVYNDKLTLEEIEARSWMSPPIDLYGKLTNAVENGSLIVLIPWLVQYLAMTDGTTLRLPYYEAIYDKLFALFLSSTQKGKEGQQSKSGITTWNALLIRCCLGWLFEQPHFPSERFFHYLNKTDLFMSTNNQQGQDHLDSVEMIDLNVLYTICPFLKEFKKLLQYDCNRNGRITSKHITPVTSLQVTNTEMNEKRLRLQLEEALLNTKPSSLRKTLEFVSERVASSIVKTICYDLVPEVKGNASVENKKRIITYVNVDLTEAATKSDLKLKSCKIMESHLTKLKEQCEEVSAHQINTKIHPAVKSLLSADEQPGTIDVCAEIANRMCQDRVKQWINTHVNSSVFKDFDIDFERVEKILQKERDERNAKQEKFKNLPIQGHTDVHHIDSDGDDTDTDGISAIVWNPSKLLTNLQRKCAWVVSTAHESPMPACKPHQLTSDEVLELLAHSQRCRQHRCDFSEIAWHQTNILLLDLLLLIITHFPKSISNDIIGKFVDFWSSHMEDVLKDIFIRVISIRNVVVLMHGTAEDSSMTWKLYSHLLSRLLTAGILPLQEFEAQCLSVFRENWDSKTLECFCTCLQDVVDSHGNKDQFSFLLSFLADYCTDLEF